MPRPTANMITFTIDGREVEAPENMMLVDAAKLADIEIPVFCYEPKLGDPVGACRMCLVEIEGIGKLQTGCSTPVKDGMVVHSRSERAQAGQRAVVEFLLINHPLDCPVCDKGGECPLQDISFGWGGGISRFVEPKRHFVKPLELSPLIAIDRERCIVCYRCVRFSQEISEDYQLVLLERGVHTYVSTFDSHPYVAPFSGNIIELCPVGALTSRGYRFRARPWEIEGAGSICMLCPAQCNVRLTVRDEHVERVLAREHPEVDDGWLCDKGRFAYQSLHVDERITAPLVREQNGKLLAVSWDVALDRAAQGLEQARGRVAALAGGQSSNEEGYLLARLMREGLDSEQLDTPDTIDPRALHSLAEPELQGSVPDLEYAHTVLVVGTEPVDDMPILDLRIRKGMRRHGLKVAVISARPSALDAGAEISLRCAPHSEGAVLAALARALPGGDIDQAAGAADADPEQIRSLARLVRSGSLEAGASPSEEPQEIVICYGQRILAPGSAGEGSPATGALLELARSLGLSGRENSGLLGVPSQANGRGLLEAGFAPGYGPGYQALGADGEGTRPGGAGQIGEQLAAGELGALYLLGVDPLRCVLPRAVWQEGLERAEVVIAHASFLTEGLLEHADVIFPEESYAERDGTVVHPDGRLQRLRSSISREGEIRPGWRVLSELARRLSLDLHFASAESLSQALFEASPIYRGLTLDEIGGRGVRWQTRAAAADFPAAPAERVREAGASEPRGAARSNGALRLGSFRSIWAATEVTAAPSLSFLTPTQTVELSPADSERLQVVHGEDAIVRAQGNGAAETSEIRGTVYVRAACPPGSVFLQDGIGPDSASALAGPLVYVLNANREDARRAQEAELAQAAGEDADPASPTSAGAPAEAHGSETEPS